MYKIGDKINEWTVVGEPFKETRKIDGVHEKHYPCQCSCGNYRPVKEAQLKNNHSKSCGWCVGVTSNSQRLYSIWRGMRMRCLNPSHNYYSAYGGRGIKVSESWISSFKEFKKWALENGYAPDLQIDRTNNDGNYEPENCAWVTQRQNSTNKRTTHLVTAFGETKCLMDWINDERCVVPYTTLRGRLSKGISPEQAITQKKDRMNVKRRDNRYISVGGETKTLTAWTRDKRCSVKRSSIVQRLKRGYSPEDAVFIPQREAKR